MQAIKDSQSITIRQPATANLMIDSADRNEARDEFANDFSIQKPQSIVNGFIHRIGTTEVILDWNTPNISAFEGVANDEMTVVTSTATGFFSTTFFIPDGFYNVSTALEAVRQKINQRSSILGIDGVDVGPSGLAFGADIAVLPISVNGIQYQGPLADALEIAIPGQFARFPIQVPLTVDLRPTRYVDFVSPQLTYNQELKDNSTAPINRDVLNRWYFANDTAMTYDAWGYPIQMGYEPFNYRRLYNPPKQIRWDNIQPIGNLTFEVYNDQGVLCPMNSQTNWLMTLQLSED
jgi:hypothetical protein